MRALFLLLLYSGSVTFGIAASLPEKLELQNAPEINIDPYNAGNFAIVTLTNYSGRSSTVSLTAGGITTREGVPVHNPKVTIAPPEAAISTDRYSPAGELSNGESLTVKLSVTGLPANGAYTISLFNGPRLCGRINVIGFPFRVHFNGPADGSSTVLVGGGQTSFTLRNDDPLPYNVRWSLSVPAGKATKTISLGPLATEDVTVTNADCEGGQGSGLPACLDGVHGVWDRLSSLLRDPKQDGKLTLTYAPHEETEMNPALIPHLAIPVKVVTHLRTPELTSLLGSSVLLLFLTLGAALSVFTNLWIPHNLRRNDICTRLMLLIRSIREISENIPSHVRISAEVDAKEIRERLLSAGWFYSNFETVLRYYEAQTAGLEARVQLLQQADDSYKELTQLTDMTVPPTYLTQATLAFEPAMDIFAGSEWSASEQDLAMRLVQDFKTHVEKVGRIRQSGIDAREFSAVLESRFKLLRVQLSSPMVTGIVQEFQTMFPRPFRRLGQDNVADGSELPDWVQLDYDLWKLDLIRQFVTSYDSALSQSRRDSLREKAGFPDGARPGSLLYFLQLDTWDALRCAELLCKEISEGIFPDHICDAIQQTPPRVAIKIRQKEIMAGRRVDCELCFVNYSLNTASARREIKPKWTFSSPSANLLAHGDHGFLSAVKALGWGLKHMLSSNRWRTPMSPKTERGWVVSCLVPDIDRVQVTVCFEDWYGAMRASGEQNTLRGSFTIVPRDTGLRSARRLLETGRSLVALAIPVLGLLAGARDKLLDLDVSTALLAVFALGFSTDSIKSALLRGTVTSQKGVADSDASRSAKPILQPVPSLHSGLGAGTKTAVAGMNQ